MTYFVRSAAAKLLMPQFYYAYILTIPYTCADPEIFPEVQGLFSAILLYVYIRNLKNPHPTLDLRMLIWMEINAIPAWIGEMLKDNVDKIHYYRPPLSLSLGFIFVYVHPKVKYIYICYLCLPHAWRKLYQNNYKRTFIQYPQTAFWQAMY